MRLRTALSSLAFGIALSSAAVVTAGAQVSGPSTTDATTAQPASPTQYYPQYGVSGSIAIPAGRLGDDHAAGYGIGGLVEFGFPNQPYALRAEAMFQRFSLKSGRTTGSDVSLFNLGPTIVYRMNQTPAETFLTGGIAIYHATDEGTRPGFNLGAGIGFPLTDFSALAEIRLHVMLADGKPVLALPLSVGVRF
ncbi:MAG TPA: outer membrane beta-barrel protein [Gemmatimonadaceae bacterium]|jgi:Outer membrane protein beta-barrel domain|nr:outer membrane beta-barrel protein [Gemmatimonadaceae bacterium]